MSKAKHEYITRRSVLLVACGLAAGTIAAGLAIAAAPQPVACTVDPLLTAISRHQAAAKAVDDALTAGMTYPALQSLADAEYKAAEAVANTVPVTEAGAVALREHLADERYGALCRYYLA
jgi:hypothetical protein